MFDKIPWQKDGVVLLARVLSFFEHRDEKDLSGFIAKNRHDVRVGFDVEMDVVENQEVEAVRCAEENLNKAHI